MVGIVFLQKKKKKIDKKEKSTIEPDPAAELKFRNLICVHKLFKILTVVSLSKFFIEWITSEILNFNWLHSLIV